MTLIDALVVSLNLDASKFKAGQKDANAGLKAMSEGATKTGADVQRVAQGMTQGFAKVRTELLGLLGLFAASRGLGNLTSEITGQDAALGRLSSRIGVSTEDLSAWDRAAQSAGATSGEAMGSIASLSSAFEKFRLTGQGGDSFIPYLSRLGVHLTNANGKMKDATEQQLEFARAFQAQDKIDPKATDFLGGQIPGMSQGMIDFLRRGPQFVQGRLDKQRQIGLPTQQDTRNAQDILEQLGYVDGRMQTFGRHLLNDVSPGITRVLTRLGDWLDKHLPGWYAKIDPIISGFMKKLDGLDFNKIAVDIEHFGTRVSEVFTALSNWQPPAWLEWLKTQAVGSPGAPENGGAGNNTGRDGNLLGHIAKRLGLGADAAGQKAMDYFVSQGWTPEQAAGIAGNLQQESSFRPEAGINSDGSASAHAGIAQWDKTRREAIEAHFGKKLGEMDYGEQLRAVQFELTQGLHKASGDKLRRETTAAGSSSSVARNYEIPVGANDPDATKKWSDEEGWRRQYAENALGKYPGAGKRTLDHDGGFLDGFRNPPAQISVPPKPWVAAPTPEWHPLTTIAKLADNGQDQPGDGTPESPNFAALRRLLNGDPAAIAANNAVPTAAQRWGGSVTNNTAHHDNSSVTNINGPINVHTQAKDAHGIARDIDGALRARSMARQSNRGVN